MLMHNKTREYVRTVVLLFCTFNFNRKFLNLYMCA